MGGKRGRGNRGVIQWRNKGGGRIRGRNTGPVEIARLCEGKASLNFKERRLRPRNESLPRPALPRKVRALVPPRHGPRSRRLFVICRTNPFRLMFDKPFAAGYSHARLLQRGPARLAGVPASIVPPCQATQPEPASPLTGRRSACDRTDWKWPPHGDSNNEMPGESSEPS